MRTELLKVTAYAIDLPILDLPPGVWVWKWLGWWKLK